MAKFSDSPYFILKTFFDNISTTRTSIKNAHLRGPNQIITTGGHGLDLYVKSDDIFSKIHAYNTDTYLDGNIFSFTFDVTRSDVTTDVFTDLSDAKVYIRKGSIFYDYVNSLSSLDNYINTEKYLQYFGKIYITSANTFSVIYVGMKDYVMKALPLNNRTDNLTVFLNTYFDEVHNEVYLRTKDLNSLTDAHDVPEEYLEQLSSTYNDTSNEDMDTDILRAYVSNIIYLLKRKGTYTDMHIIWKILTSNTMNTLTVLERWHNQDFTGIPIDEFTDVPHTYRYKEYNELPETCAGESWWRRLSNTSTYPYQVYSDDPQVWVIKHDLDSRHIFTQCYDEDYNMIVPDTITPIDSNNLQLTFGKPTLGFAFLHVPDNIYHQELSSDEWSVEHLPAGTWTETLQQLEYEDNSKFISDSISMVDDENYTVTLAENTTGYAIQVDPSYRHSQGSSSKTWTIDTSTLDKLAMLVQCYGTDGTILNPLNVRINIDTDDITVTFDDTMTGYAVVKDMLWGETATTFVYDTSATSLVLTPHYKVMMDLSCEALGDTYIIDETTVTNLIDKWELLRPVCKYAHYNTLLAPKTDFTGSYIPLYDYNLTDNKGGCNMRCCDEVTGPTSGSYVYKTLSNLPIWVASHNLGSEHIFTQCYDENLSQIIPVSIEPVNSNTTKITFAHSVSGYAFLSKSEYTHTESPAASAWNITYSPSGSDEYALVQFEDIDKNVFMPDEINMVDETNFTGTMAEAKTGYAIHVASDYTHSQSPASAIWTIYHGLDYQALSVQAYDSDNNMVMPISVHINNNNASITLTFIEAIAGHAAVKAVGQLNTMSLIMAEISYCKLGSSGGVSWDPVIENDIEDTSGAVTITDLIVSEDSNGYYIPIEYIDGDEDAKSITEAGIFNSSDEMKFYMYCDEVYKRTDVGFSMYFRINKIVS